MPQIFSGARAKFYINEKPIGFCAGVSGEEAVDYEPVETLEHLEVREHIPVSYRASLSAAFFRLIGSSLKEYTDGSAGGMSIFPKFDNILSSGEMTASIHANEAPTADGDVANVAMFHGVRAASKTFDVSSRGIVTENCSFIAIKQMDESEVNV